MSVTVGIITYHAAYNFGSVLQALATQEAYKQQGAEARIINYRPQSQVSYYEPLYRTQYSYKVLLNDLSLFPVKKKRIQRAEKFEKFISNNLNLTERINASSELKRLSASFDLYVSGSDQIINIHSNEYVGEGWDAMKPYLLDFTQRRKVSYASSPANMTHDELRHIVSDLKSFDMLSAREQDAAATLSEMTGKDVKTVLDPTLLLEADQWRRIAAKNAQAMHLPKQYAVYYTLGRTKNTLPKIPNFSKLSKTLDMPLVVVCPFAIFPESKTIIDGRNTGPAEFIQLIDNASVAITDSYHGTLFSMNLQTPFLSISNGKGSSTRKDRILERMHLEDNIVADLSSAISRLNRNGIPQSRNVDAYLKPERNYSLSYVKDTLAL